MKIFRAVKDLETFKRVGEGMLRVARMWIAACGWMPNHWHFVLWPEHDGDLCRFLQRMTNMRS